MAESSSSEGVELGEAFITLKLRRDKLQSDLRQVEGQMKEMGAKAESEAQGGGMMGKFLFGRNGPDGMGASLERGLGHAAFGRMFRTFSAGGAIGVGIGIASHFAVDLGKSLISAAFGFDKLAEAAERATKKAEDFAAAEKEVEKARIDLAKSDAPPTAGERFKEIMHPATASQKVEQAMKASDDDYKKSQALVEALEKQKQSVSISKEEHESLLNQYGMTADTGWGGFGKTLETIGDSGDRQKVRAEEKQLLDMRRDKLQQQIDARRHGGSYEQFDIQTGKMETKQDAETYRQRNQIMLGMFGGIGQAGRFLGGGIPGLSDLAASTGRTAMHGAGAVAGAMGRGYDPFSMSAMFDRKMADVDARQAKGERGFGASGLTDHYFERQKAMEEKMREPHGVGAASDVGDIGQAMQAALLEPSPHEQEKKELMKEQVKLLNNINDGVQVGKGPSVRPVVGPAVFANGGAGAVA